MPAMNKIQRGQSFLDKVIQLTGSVENAFEVAVQNDMSITDVREIGEEIRTNILTNKYVVQYLKNKQPATATNNM